MGPTRYKHRVIPGLKTGCDSGPERRGAGLGREKREVRGLTGDVGSGDGGSDDGGSGEGGSGEVEP